MGDEKKGGFVATLPPNCVVLVCVCVLTLVVLTCLPSNASCNKHAQLIIAIVAYTFSQFI
jgi:hypothetical protein